MERALQPFVLAAFGIEPAVLRLGRNAGGPLPLEHAALEHGVQRVDADAARPSGRPMASARSQSPGRSSSRWPDRPAAAIHWIRGANGRGPSDERHPAVHGARGGGRTLARTRSRHKRREGRLAVSTAAGPLHIRGVAAARRLMRMARRRGTARRSVAAGAPVAAVDSMAGRVHLASGPRPGRAGRDTAPASRQNGVAAWNRWRTCGRVSLAPSGMRYGTKAGPMRLRRRSAGLGNQARRSRRAITQPAITQWRNKGDAPRLWVVTICG